MQLKYAVLIFALIFAVIYVFGLIGNEQCTSIGKCNACWKEFPVTANSDLCPTSAPCVQEPYKQQRNAMIDIIVCACTEAKSKPELNKRIEEVFNNYMGFSLASDKICDPYSPYMTKVSYG